MDTRRLQALLLAATLVFAPVSAYPAQVDEEPTGFEMMADLVVARPVGIAMFALGSATFVATLPFSLLGGNTGEVGKTLVIDPAKEAFVRCLGCTRPGRKEKLKN